ncbi:MAG TPA: ChbG/HpnK family deacetylase [Terriglobales bacterium]|nr:ChbG/HpnK family deacetylase [Terriglobales bacterium]
MRRLIVNADDFGLTYGVNRAIVEAHEHGIVTSTTLMANGSALAHAVELSATVPQLSVGCHVVLVDGSPVNDPQKVHSLLAGEQSSRFRTAISDFALNCLRGKLAPNEIDAEATAQIRKLQTAGITVSHLDTHKHTHLFPQVLRPLLKAAQNCGLRAVRNPAEPIRLTRIATQPGLWKRWVQVRVLNRLASQFRSAVKDAGMVTPDGSLGVLITGVMDERLLKTIIDHIPDGTWELVCHPGYNDEDLNKIDTRLRSSRVKELELLKSPAIRAELERHEVQLISYRDLH